MDVIKLENLKEKLPYKWRVQSFSEYKPECSCVAYVDSRDVQNLLDRVVGPENWQDEYYQVKNTMLCKIGIKINGEWVWKGDGGTETDIESEKGELSDSFKRAAVKWGIGRFLYDLDIVKLPANEVKDKAKKNYPYPVDPQGKRIWDITEYINNMSKSGNNTPIRNDVPQIPTTPTKKEYTAPKGQKLFIEYINEIKTISDTNELNALADECKALYKSEKQMAWIDKDIQARKDFLKNMPF